MVAGSGRFFCLPVGAPSLEEELLGCFGHFAPVDGDGGGRGGYMAEPTRVAHFFERKPFRRKGWEPYIRRELRQTSQKDPQRFYHVV